MAEWNPVTFLWQIGASNVLVQRVGLYAIRMRVRARAYIGLRELLRLSVRYYHNV